MGIVNSKCGMIPVRRIRAWFPVVLASTFLDRWECMLVSRATRCRVENIQKLLLQNILSVWLYMCGFSDIQDPLFSGLIFFVMFCFSNICLFGSVHVTSNGKLWHLRFKACFLLVHVWKVPHLENEVTLIRDFLLAQRFSPRSNPFSFGLNRSFLCVFVCVCFCEHALNFLSRHLRKS